MSDVVKHGSHDQKTHAGGRGKGGAGSGSASTTGRTNADGKPLTRSQDKKLDDLSIDLFNNNQSITPAMRAGKINTPAAQAVIQRGQKIVTEAQQVYGGSRGDALNELNRRMGKPSL